MNKCQIEYIEFLLKAKVNFCKLVLKEGTHSDICVAEFNGMCDLARELGFPGDLLITIINGFMD